MNKLKAFRPIYRRTDSFTVVRPIRISGTEVLEPGTVIKPKEFTRFQKLRWYRARWIGQTDCLWVEQALERYAEPEEVVGDNSIGESESSELDQDAEITDSGTGDAEDNESETDNVETDETDDAETKTVVPSWEQE